MSTHRIGRDRRDFDVVVVGSGFGGAVAAARLAESGRRVLVLERGDWRDGGNDALMRNLRWARGRRSFNLVLNAGGLWELTLLDRLAVLSGSAVGGGSRVYARVQMRPDPTFFDSLPPELMESGMHACFDRVRTALGSAPARETPARTDTFESAVGAAGLGLIERPELATASLDITYLARALRNGAEVRSLCEAQALDVKRRRYEVRWFDRRTRRHHMTSAPELVLAAGALGTLRLLFAARDRDRTLPGISAKLGRGFSPNGDFATFIWRSRLLRDSHRRPIACAVVQSSAPAGRWTVAEMGMPARWLRRSAVVFGMGRSAAGLLEFDGRDIRTTLDRSLDPTLYADIARAELAVALQYRARRVVANAPFGGRARWRLTAHPLGGAAIAESPDDGVTDHAGRVFGFQGLRLADASLLPASPGVPPALTIAALAEHQADVLLRET
jgi:cholesterol oxidase